MRRLRALCVAAVVVMAAQAAGADTSTVADDQDTGDTMDLATASHGHGNAPRVLRHSLSTFEGWTNQEFVRAHIFFWLADGDRWPDRVLHIYRNPDESLGGSIFVVVGGPGCGTATGYCEQGALRGYANAYRSGGRSFVAEFPRRTLKTRLTKYRWKAFLTYPCHPPEGAVCAPPPPDTHPGRVLHDLH